MNKIRIYTMTFVLGVIFIAGLMMVSATGFEAPTDQEVPTPTDCWWTGGVPDPFGEGCICPPDTYYIPGYGCSATLCIDMPAFHGCGNDSYLTPMPTPMYPVPPPPPGGFGGFLQPIINNTLYSSVDYQIYNENSNIRIQSPAEKDILIPGFVIEEYSNWAEPPAQNKEIFSADNGQVKFYFLTTDEFQINIGPDVNGDVRVIIFDGLNAQYVYGYTFNVYDILNP